MSSICIHIPTLSKWNNIRKIQDELFQLWLAFTRPTNLVCSFSLCFEPRFREMTDMTLHAFQHGGSTNRPNTSPYPIKTYSQRWNCPVKFPMIQDRKLEGPCLINPRNPDRLLLTLFASKHSGLHCHGQEKHVLENLSKAFCFSVLRTVARTWLLNVEDFNHTGEAEFQIFDDRVCILSTRLHSSMVREEERRLQFNRRYYFY